MTVWTKACSGAERLQQLPAGVDKVTACCLILMLEHEFKQPEVGPCQEDDGQRRKFMRRSQEYDGEDMPDNEIRKSRPS